MAVFQVNFMAETLGRTVPLFVILPTDKSYLPEFMDLLVRSVSISDTASGRMQN